MFGLFSPENPDPLAPAIPPLPDDGDLTSDAKFTIVVNGQPITRQQGVRYRDVAFSHDGKSLIAVSDESGDYEFWKFDLSSVDKRTPLTKDGDVGLDETEQATNNRGDSVKVTWAEFALKHIGQTHDRYIGGEALRVDFLGLGHIDRVDTEWGQLLCVLDFGARIIGQILGVVELFGVHKDRDDHPVTTCLCGLNQRQMPLMQRAHGRNHADLFTLPRPFRGQGTQVGQTAKYWGGRVFGPLVGA